MMSTRRFLLASAGFAALVLSCPPHRALALRQKRAGPGDSPSLETAANLRDLAQAASQESRLTRAEEFAARAWEIVRGQGALVAGDEARFGAANASYAAELISYRVALGRAAEAFVTLEESRAPALQQ